MSHTGSQVQSARLRRLDCRRKRQRDANGWKGQKGRRRHKGNNAGLERERKLEETEERITLGGQSASPAGPHQGVAVL